MTRASRAVLSAGVLAAAALLVTGSAGADVAPRSEFQVAAAAIPTGVLRTDDAQAVQFSSTTARAIHVTGVATASTTCDGCSGQAVTMAVIYADSASSVDVRNVAAAWASNCMGCGGWAVSIQIVVARTATVVRAANRAFAVNAACAYCATSSAALQFVVVGPGDRHLSGAASDRLMSLRERLAGLLRHTLRPARTAARTPTAPSSSARPASGADAALRTVAGQIDGVLVGDLHATAVRHDVRTDQG